MSSGKQKKALVLLINDSGLQLHAWENGVFAWRNAFRATPAELEDFGAALDPFLDFPVIIITDLIEESFRHDTVVHVTGADRAAVLKRKLDFVFRNSTYRQADVLERETTGRRDDRILLSAITKPDLVEIWVRVLLEKRLAIQSVTSVAHLLHDFALINKLDQEQYLLIINIEQSGNLRQTFIRKGKVMFSRLTPMQSRENALLGTDVLQETLQLRQYFERIQLVPYEATLRIQVYSGFDDAFLQLETRSTENTRFDVFDVGPMLAAMNVDLGEQAPCPVHYFAAKVLAGRQPANIYAPPPATKYQDLARLARAIWVTSAIVALVGIGICIPPVLSIMEQYQQRDVARAQAQPLQAEYARLTERFPETPIPSREMQLVVETHDVIASQVHTPINVFNMIGRALAGSTGLQLNNISWELVEKPAVIDAAAMEQGYAMEPVIAPAEGITGLVLMQRTAIEVLIEGEAFSPASFREAQQQVNTLIAALSGNPGVKVVAAKMPTEIRTDVSVTTTVDDREVRGPFALQLTLTTSEPPANLAVEESGQ